MKKIIGMLCLACVAQTCAALESSKTLTTHDIDPTVILEANHFNWYAVAVEDHQGISKVREFHDMGTHGVQQIDYIVNCNNLSMALADFVILTPTGRLPNHTTYLSVAELSFYKPVIEHDIKILGYSCAELVARELQSNLKFESQR